MSSQTVNLNLERIDEGQTGGEDLFNESLQSLDSLYYLLFEGFDTNTPPGSPTAGQCWKLGGSPTGVWAGHANEIAIWWTTPLTFLSNWRFVTPQIGWRGWLTGDGGEGTIRTYGAGGWVGGVTVAALSGGETDPDVMATKVNDIMAELRLHGYQAL